MKLRIVLDWDGVVFNDEKFKNDLLSNLSQHSHLEIQDIKRLYYSSKNENGYNDRRLADAIAAKTSLSSASLLGAISSILDNDGPAYIYPSSLDFLQNISKHYPITILTAGDERIQHHKIMNSGLGQYIDEIIVTSVEKTEVNKQYALEKLLDTEEAILFFDDKISTILHLHEVFRDKPSILPVWVNEKYDESVSNGVVTYQLIATDMPVYESVLMQRRTLISAANIKEAGKAIMVQENKGRAKNLWTVPIGHVDAGETFLETIIREVEEETGIKTHPKDFHDLLLVDGVDYLGGDQDVGSKVVIACFDMAAPSLSTETLPVGELNWRWVDSSTLTTLPLRGEWQYRLVR